MLRRSIKAGGTAVCAGLLVGGLLGGCVSSRPAGSGPASADPVAEAIGRCAAATIGGAVVGTLIGAAAGGGRGAGTGALIGGAVGGVGCAVLTALDAQDKERIRNAQIAAAATNQPRYLNYQGSDGRPRQITVRPQAAQTAETGRLCRVLDTSASIGGGSAELPPAKVCRTERGEWLPA